MLPSMTTTDTKPRWRISPRLWTVIGLVLFLDVAFSGSYLFSVTICPIWFLAAVVSLLELPGWRVALIRVAAPVLTLGIVVGNTALQWRIGEARADRVVKACEQFHTANGRYPETLDELVPRYLRSVPRAKYCLFLGNFMYYANQGLHPILVWYKLPPFGRPIYDFESGTWGYID